VGLQDYADEVTVNLPYGRKRALEIATTLAMEPEADAAGRAHAGHGPRRRGPRHQLIKKVAAGRTMLMVEHNMNVVASIADRITVLQRGAIIGRRHLREVSKQPAGDGGLHGHDHGNCKGRTE
jgi:branched-chain amino acid transport system ATP-binding protein